MVQKKWLGIGLLMILVIIITGCSSVAAAPQAQEGSPQRTALPVEVAPAEVGNIAATYAYAGDLYPQHSLSLVSIVSGAVEEVMVEVGDTVRAGDPIMRVEDTAYRAQLKQAEAALTVAQTNLLKMQKGPRAEQIEMAEVALNAARTQLNGLTTMSDDERTVASSNLARAESALRLAQYEYDKIKWAGQVSQTPQALQLQQATIAYQTAQSAYNMQANPDDASLAQLRAGIRQAELNLQILKNPTTPEDLALVKAGISQAEALVAMAQYQVDNTILRAPFDGVVSEVYVSTGNVASPQSPIIKLISTNLEVKVEVPENQIAGLYKDQPAALKVPAYPGTDFPALITTIAPAADTTSHTFPVTIKPVDAEGKLKAGMFAEITVLLQEKDGVVFVPRAAITTVAGQSVVYVVSADEKTVVMRPVVTGLSDDGRIEITDGVSVGETVVIAGLNSLSDGAPVTIVSRTE